MHLCAQISQQAATHQCHDIVVPFSCISAYKTGGDAAVLPDAVAPVTPEQSALEQVSITRLQIVYTYILRRVQNCMYIRSF